MAEITSRLKAALADRYTTERQLGAGGYLYRPVAVFFSRCIRRNRKFVETR